MQLNTYIIGFLLLATPVLSAQNQEENEEIHLDPVSVNFLYNYYQQDGDNAAVTGGKGTEYLYNNAPMVIVNIPIRKKSSLGVSAGIDSYTSASSANIDKYETGASGSRSIEEAVSAKDTRYHIDANYTEKISKSFYLGFSGGYSKEFDVTSFNIGGNIMKSFNDENQKLSLSTHAYMDEWLLIYPGEIRNRTTPGLVVQDFPSYSTARPSSLTNPMADHHHKKKKKDKVTRKQLSKTDFNTDNRFTFNTALAYEWVVGKRTIASILLDYTMQKGLLSTPFHRVYFNDGIQKEEKKSVRVEKLPEGRQKFAMGLKLNQYITYGFTGRFFYRYYWDDFGITAHSFQIETPIKIGRSVMLSPFFRYYSQNESTYFAPYGKHEFYDAYYTSDYDLSGFSSFFRGVELGIRPPKGIFTFHFSKKSYINCNSLQLRYSNYERTNGLHANNISFSTIFLIR